jgi:membrane fusion protein (multidrug efflux system)
MNRLVLSIITVVASVVFWSCGDKKAVAPNPASLPVPVNLYEAHLQAAVYFDQYPGTIVPIMQVDIKAQVEGYITAILFKEGDHVRKGQALYKIDPVKYQATMGQSQANVQVAQANLEQAQKDADRYTYLNEHEAVAKQTLDHALTTLQNAKNQLAAAKQDIVKNQTDLNYAVIKAPFDGIIGISQVKVGNTIVPGQTVLNTVSTEGPVAVDIVVNEKQIPHFVKLQTKTTNLKDSVFTLLLPDNTVYGYPGEIFFMDRGVNTQTGTITVRLKFPDPSGVLRAGMSCKIKVHNQDTEPQLIIPGKAIVEQMGEFFVYVAKDTAIKSATDSSGKAMPHAIQKKVTLGQQIADRIIVKSGLNDGDNVIVDGVQKLHDGSLIMSKPPAPAADGKH